MHRCKFCQGRIRRKKFENTNAYLGRDYCEKPKCMSQGREGQLAEIYAKEKDDPAGRHAIAFFTRTLFIYRWGMEPMEAMDKYGEQASEDWMRIYTDVSEGRCMQVRVTVQVCDNKDAEIASTTAMNRFHLPAMLAGSEAEDIARDMANGAHQRILERLYDKRPNRSN